jgi:ATP-dependent DNA helicase PIF1
MSVERSVSKVKGLLADPSGPNVIFVTGQAGTGKSTFVRSLRSLGLGNLVVVAPTGVAALNVHGSTIHSFFGFKPKVLTDKDVSDTPINDVHKNLKFLVIDEVSMVSPDIIDGIRKFLKKAKKSKDRAFGGVRLVLVGDLLQLEPVVNDQAEARRWFFTKYKSPGFFEAEALNEIEVFCIKLEENFRQKSDLKFLRILSEIRSGAVTAPSLRKLNTRFTDDARDEEVVLCATNEEVSNINENKLELLLGDAALFECEASGSFARIQDDEKGSKLPAPRVLQLKEGAKVMLLRNDPRRRWVNGSMGEIVGFDEDEIEVIFDHSGETHSIERESWESYEYKFDKEKGEIESYISGVFTQFPVSLGWAITIHKAQGKTIEAVHINLREGSRLSLPGQAYVAFSRCRSLDNLSISRKLSVEDFPAPKTAAASIWAAISSFSDGLGVIKFSTFGSGAGGVEESSDGAVPAGAITHNAAIRALVDRAIDDEFEIRMGYRNAEGVYSDRVVVPSQWENRNNFTAFCSLNDYEERMFAVTRIEWAIEC